MVLCRLWKGGCLALLDFVFITTHKRSVVLIAVGDKQHSLFCVEAYQAYCLHAPDHGHRVCHYACLDSMEMSRDLHFFVKLWFVSELAGGGEAWQEEESPPTLRWRLLRRSRCAIRRREMYALCFTDLPDQDSSFSAFHCFSLLLFRDEHKRLGVLLNVHRSADSGFFLMRDSLFLVQEERDRLGVMLYTCSQPRLDSKKRKTESSTDGLLYLDVDQKGGVRRYSPQEGFVFRAPFTVSFLGGYEDASPANTTKIVSGCV